MLYKKFALLLEQINLEKPPSKKRRMQRESIYADVPRKYKLTKDDVKQVAKEFDEWGFKANPNLKKLFGIDD